MAPRLELINWDGGYFNWVPEGSLAGLFGVHVEVRPAPGAREGLQICGGRSPPHCLGFSRAPGAGQTSKTHLKKSGHNGFRYPELGRRI